MADTDLSRGFFIGVVSNVSNVSNPQRAHTGWNAASAALDLMAFGAVVPPKP
jgi:hypothetical protein